MTDDSYYAERDDRLLRYPQARRLDQSRWLVIRADQSYLHSYAGQVALLTAANLFGRMARRIALDIPQVTIVHPLPWAGKDLRAFALAQMQASDPQGEFEIRSAMESDHLIYLGESGAPIITHGSGWFAYHGPGPSPLPKDNSANPIGAALAVIATAARLAVDGFKAPATAIKLNAYNWTHNFNDEGIPQQAKNLDLGAVWTIGTGSVGTAILYFLSLATRNFSSLLFDNDKVKRENITRSPLFTDADIGHAKVNVTVAYLKSCGMTDVVGETAALHESLQWQNRPPGTPDIVIASANEHNVRHLIESLFPPIQIYATTGKNWQASVIRHIPMVDACSCCLFPETNFAPTICATDQEMVVNSDTQIDASLPFLSFAAGLMAAAEILKLQVPAYYMNPNRAFLWTMPEPRFIRAGVTLRTDCVCGKRSRTVHQKMIEGSRYAALSTLSRAAP